MRRISFIGLVIGLSVLWIQHRPPSERTVEESIGRGLDFLHQIRSETSVFQDPYLTYRYPAEDLPGQPPEGFPLTYRVVDALLQLRYLAEVRENLGPIRTWAERAERELKVLPPVWQHAQIRYLKGKEKPKVPTVALDTFCLVGLLHKDRAMAERMRDEYVDGRWLPPHFFHPKDAWREMADESWCMIYWVEMFDQVYPLRKGLEVQLQELQALRDKPWPGIRGEVNRIGALIHLVMLGQKLEAKGVLQNTSFAVKQVQFERELVKSFHEYWHRHFPGLLANTIDILLQSSRKEVREAARAQIDHLLRLQRASGVFAPPGRAEGAPAFTTVRTLTALSRSLRLDR